MKRPDVSRILPSLQVHQGLISNLPTLDFVGKVPTLISARWFTRIVLLTILCNAKVFSQTPQIDSLRIAVKEMPSDSSQVSVLNKISFLNLAHSPDSMLYYAQQAIDLGDKIGFLRGVGEGYKNKGTAYYTKGFYELGIESFYTAFTMAEKIGDLSTQAKVLHNIGGAYFFQEDYEKALEFTLKSLNTASGSLDSTMLSTIHLSICECYQRLNQPDKGIPHCEVALDYYRRNKNEERMAHGYHYLAENLLLKQQDQPALDAFWSASHLVRKGNYFSVGLYLYHDLGRFYLSHSQPDSAKYYFNLSMALLKQYDSKDALMLMYRAMGDYYEYRRRYDSSQYYFKAYADLLKNDFITKRQDQLLALETNYDLERHRQQLKANQDLLQKNRTIILFITFILITSIIATIIVLRFYFAKKKANQSLTELNKTIVEKNEEILTQSEELIEANEEIRRINENLESIIHERTREVQLKNEKLVEFAYFNAHQVRGPLARILGLVNLLNLEQLNVSTQEITDKINQSAIELDEVVREINQNLQE